MTVEKLKKLENVVKPILEEQPQTRNDDYLLYAVVIEKLNDTLLALPTGLFLYRHKDFNVPNMKSVERARRKIQEKHPELASDRAKKKRAEEQATYIAYSKY